MQSISSAVLYVYMFLHLSSIFDKHNRPARVLSRLSFPTIPSPTPRLYVRAAAAQWELTGLQIYRSDGSCIMEDSSKYSSHYQSLSLAQCSMCRS